MRVFVDVSPLSHPRTGIGNYIRGSLAGLVEAAGDRHQVVAFAPTSLAGPERIQAALDGIPVETRLWPLPASHAVRTAWSVAGRPSLERLVGPVDALLYTDWMTPPQRGGVRATVVHDLVPHHHPEWCTSRTIAMHRRKDADAARTCDVVFCNSEFTARDVTATLGIERERLVVAYPGLGERFSPDGERVDLGAPYVLGVGTLEPRKNLGALVEAWRLLGGDRRLVLVGGEGWGDRPELSDPRIVLPGYVADADLPRWYRGASAFVYPSRFEGFGIPIVEAMACAVPVVASSHASLDEASGDAALRADPDDPSALADALEKAERQRDELVARGLAHARRFDWGRTGRTMLEALEERAARRGGGA